MPSSARKAFDENLKDIEKLMELHEKEGGKLRGRRYNLEVLNKSAIVLITSYWEAYCEDIAAEALKHIVKNTKNSDALPTELKKLIAKELENNNHELAIWEVADEKWRGYLISRLENLQETRNRKLNTPRTDNIDVLFKTTIGITRISSSWKWAKKMTVARARSKLNKFVTLRGSIAHRGKSSESVTKAQVKDYVEFIKQLAAKTGGKVNTHVRSVTDKSLWLTRRSSGRKKRAA